MIDSQEPRFFSKRNIISIIVLLVLALGAAAGFYITRNQTTQLLSKASDVGSCNDDDGSYCMWADSAPNTGQPIRVGGQAYVFVVGTGGDTNVKIRETDGSEINGTYDGRTHPASDCTTDTKFKFCWIFLVPNIVNKTYAYTFISTEKLSGRFSDSFTPEPAQVAAPPAGNPGAQTPTTGCPIADWQNRSNEELISKCNHGELAQLPNSRLEGFPNDVLELFPNDRLDDLSLGFLAGLRNERLLLFSNEFLTEFPNERLIKLPLDRLKTFPPKTIDSFSCELRAQLGRPCQTGGNPQPTPTFNASSCEGIRIAKGSDVYVNTASNPPVYRILEVGQEYNVSITLKNIDKNKSSYTPATWSKGNIGQDKAYFLGFPTLAQGDNNKTKDADFETNIDTSDLSANIQWSISWPNKDILRLPLNKNSVGPNDSETFQFTIKPLRSSATSPNEGKHTFYWSLIQEGVEWFGAQCAINIDVDSGTSGTNPNPSGAPVGGTQCAVVSSTDIPENVKCGMAPSDVEGGLRVVEYRSHPLTDVRFGFGANTPPGDKTVHVRFISATGQVSDEYTRNILYQPGVTISSASCTYSPDGIDTIVTIDGVGFGASQGQSKITANNILINSAPISWTDTKVQMKNPGKLTGSAVPIKITTADGKSSTQNCQVIVSSVDFTTRIQCRTPDKAVNDELDIKIFDASSTSTTPIPRANNTKPKLDAQGKPQNFQAQLEASKPYVIIVKAPGTLARKLLVPASSNRIIDQTLVLPVGDISGSGQDSIPDGVVNVLDRNTLGQQWSIGVDVVRSGDFNKDKRVNSIDYSCMVATQALQNTGSGGGPQDEVFNPATDTVAAGSGAAVRTTSITLTADKLTPNNGDRVTFSGVLKDSQNNPVSGKVVKLIDPTTGTVLKSSDQTTDGITHNTDSTGSFVLALTVGSEARFSAYVKFEGDSSLNTSQSAAVNIIPVVSAGQ